MNTTPNFTPQELQHYTRHLTLPQIGTLGQHKLKHAKVLCVGAGGLGAPLLFYLTAAGVGTIGIIDHDHVQRSNLQRQILFTENDINHNKAECAKQHLQIRNPNISITAYPNKLTAENATTLISQYDIIADCTDNFATRYLINDTCVQLNKPNVHASIAQFTGQCTIFTAQDGPCYRCLHPTPPAPGTIPNCATAGVLGVLPGLLGTLQASEIIKLIVGIGEPLVNHLLKVDALSLKFDTLRLTRDPQCQTCQHRSNPMNTTNTTQTADLSWTIIPETLSEMQANGVQHTLLDVRNADERERAHIGGVFIPLCELADRIEELDSTHKIIIYCHAGRRGDTAMKLLRAAGFENVFNLAGGITGWQEFQATQDA